jgi:hypothetical protein
MNTAQLPATSRRVEQNTDPHINDTIRAQTDAEITRLEGAPPEDYAARLGELDGEWDIERVLQTNASAIVMLGVLLAWRVDRRFMLLPAAVFSFLLQHALQGWCPPIPVFRRLGVRTAREIARHRYAQKALRGDFDDVPARAGTPARERMRAVLKAVDA